MRPSAAVTLERARSLANEAVFTVALQCRRLRTNEPEDDTFVFRWWADLQFLIVALRRLRRAAQIAAGVPGTAVAVKSAIHTFDEALPGLDKMRNIGEHIDEYAVDSHRRRDRSVTRQHLQVGTWDGTTYTWLDCELNIDTALVAAENLFLATRTAAKTCAPRPPESAS